MIHQKASVTSVGFPPSHTAIDGLRFIGRALLWPLQAIVVAAWFIAMARFPDVRLVGASVAALVQE